MDGFFTNIREYQYNKDHYLSAYTIFFSGEGFPKCVEIFRLGYKTTTYLNSVQAALKSGSYVGYENVFVEEIPYPDNETELLVSQQINLAKGFKLFKYTTPEDFPTYNEQSLSYPFLPVVDKTYKQGLLKQSFVFDQNNRLLQKDSINYDFKEHLIGKSLFTYTVQSGNALSKYFHSYTDFTNNNISRFPVERGFCNPYFVFTNIIGPIIQYDFKQHYRNRVLRKHSETKEFFYDTEGLNGISVTKKDYEYWDSDYLSKSVNTTVYEPISGDTVVLSENFYYPNHLPSWYNWNVSALINSNRISKVVASQIVSNGTPTYRNATVFNNFDTSSYAYTPGDNINNIVSEVEKVLESKSTSDFHSKIDVQIYDSDRNILELKQSNGVPVSYIYGYNNSQPVAQLVGVSYSEISPTLLGDIHSKSNLDNDSCHGSVSCNETNLRTELNKLRQAFPDSQITTYTYNPLIGVTSVTDPRGQTSYYDYDNFNRLKAVRDSAGNLLEETTYNYKN